MFPITAISTAEEARVSVLPKRKCALKEKNSDYMLGPLIIREGGAF